MYSNVNTFALAMGQYAMSCAANPELVIKKSGFLSLVRENGIVSSLYRSVGECSFLTILTGLASNLIKCSSYVPKGLSTEIL